MIIPDAGIGNEEVLVEWWVPSMAPRAAFRPGPRRLVVDLFGEWRPLSALTVAEAAGCELPPIVVTRADILVINVKLDGGKIPYGVLDRLRSEHGIDVTGLSTSLTHNGNLYRSYVLTAGGSAA
jgi:hypothetical protein